MVKSEKLGVLSVLKAKNGSILTGFELLVILSIHYIMCKHNQRVV
jgi:hypothetical protein